METGPDQLVCFPDHSRLFKEGKLYNGRLTERTASAKLLHQNFIRFALLTCSPVGAFKLPVEAGKDRLTPGTMWEIGE